MKKNLINIGIYLGAIWVIFLVSLILPINNFGIIPRTAIGLIGIITAPFLHLDFQHITSNSVAIIMFAPLFVLVEGDKALEKVGALIILTGVLTWVIARPAVHIGASGLIFALYGYLISLSYFKKKILYIFLSVFLIMSYGYMIFGVFPTGGGISWESHLMGFISGLILAKYY